jgi:hypothetical protein
MELGWPNPGTDENGGFQERQKKEMVRYMATYVRLSP